MPQPDRGTMKLVLLSRAATTGRLWSPHLHVSDSWHNAIQMLFLLKGMLQIVSTRSQTLGTFNISCSAVSLLFLFKPAQINYEASMPCFVRRVKQMELLLHNRHYNYLHLAYSWFDYWFIIVISRGNVNNVYVLMYTYQTLYWSSFQSFGPLQTRLLKCLYQ